MKKFLAFALTALLLAALIPNAVFADALKIEKPEEMEYPTFNPLENSGEGFPTNSDPTKTEPESADAEKSHKSICRQADYHLEERVRQNRDQRRL